jgi:hypothetical protein
MDHGPRHPLSRSYGVILPSSLARVLSSALGCSPHLPVSVLVRALNGLATEDFLGSRSDHFDNEIGLVITPGITRADLPTRLPQV